VTQGLELCDCGTEVTACWQSKCDVDDGGGGEEGGRAWRATRAKRSLKKSVGARPRLEAMLMSVMFERSVIAGGWRVLMVAAFFGVAGEGSMIVPMASGS